MNNKNIDSNEVSIHTDNTYLENKLSQFSSCVTKETSEEVEGNFREVAFNGKDVK